MICISSYFAASQIETLPSLVVSLHKICLCHPLLLWISKLKLTGPKKLCRVVSCQAYMCGVDNLNS